MLPRQLPTPSVLCLRPVLHSVFAGSAFPAAPPAISNRVLNSHYASEISLFKLKARIQARRGQMCHFFSINRTKNMYIFEMGRKARLVQQRGGGARFASIKQRDFDIGLLYIFLLAEVVSRRILEIIFCIFYIWGGEGLLAGQSWGHTTRFSSQLFIAKRQIIYFRFHGAG